VPAAIPVARELASDFGIIEVDADGLIPAIAIDHITNHQVESLIKPARSSASWASSWP